MTVELREITQENLYEVLALEVAPEQSEYVSPNAKSLAEAHFEPKAWYRAIAAGTELVGFVMVYRDPEEQEFHIWRFMVDASHQARGYGRAAVELLLEEARRNGFPVVTLNVRPGEHSAFGFWVKFGFEDTGEVHHGQLLLRLSLERPA